MGNCWIVAALAHGAARSLGLKPQLIGGQVFADQRPLFPGGHFWTAIDNQVIDSPRADMLVVGPIDTPPRDSARYVPMLKARPGWASMRAAAARDLRNMADATYRRMLEDPPPPPGWP